jgi:DNA-binding transcriptional regulator YdaS (Cro superfamily)
VQLDPATLIASRGGPKAVAEVTGVSRRSVHRWRTGDVPLSPHDRRTIEEMPELAMPRKGRRIDLSGTPSRRRARVVARAGKRPQQGART